MNHSPVTVEDPHNPSLNSWILAARPRTLLIGICPVILGSVFAAKSGGLSIVMAFLCFIFAIAAQVGANFVNDYCDFGNGVDTSARKGFKRACASGLISPEYMKLGILVAFLVAALVGLLIVLLTDWRLIFLLLITLFAAAFYTAGPKPLNYLGFGDVMVLIFFGFGATMYTAYVQAGYFPKGIFWASLGLGLLAANVRVVNDVRDIEEDARAGKKTQVVRYGKKFGVYQYLFSAAAALMVSMILVLQGYSKWSLLTLLLAPWAMHLGVQLMQNEDASRYNQLLVRSVQLLVVYTFLLCVGL